MSHSSFKDSRQRLSREEGTIYKDWGGRLPIALVYPNSYYIGMSNLGIHAIYSFLNNHRDIVCERAFWEKEDWDNPQPTLSLESRRPLADFPILAFSVNYELDYFNIAPILKANGIPVYAAERDESHPLIIAGGPCIIANPMPLAPFFDCLCIGEAEAILPSMLPVLAEGLKGKRHELLVTLASVPGVYVPQSNPKSRIVRQWARNLDDFPVHSIVLTPDTELGDLYLIEIQRGCQWGCRFCLVSNAFHPIRFRSVDRLVAQAEVGLKYRTRLGLVGPAVSDHPRFEELLIRLKEMGAEISVSSLRIKPLHPLTLRELAKGGTRTVALAPEAGSERLRRVIKKGITEDDIRQAMHQVAEEKIKQVKLYFMIGLPTETDDDIVAIADLTLKCKAILDRRQIGSRLILTIASFIPKAGTPFERLPMEELPVLKRRLALLKSKLQPKGIQIKSESLDWSEVQAVLARGDAKLAEVLANVEKLSLSNWRQSVGKYNLDTNHYAHEKWDTTQELPWSIIDFVIKPGHLELELQRALSQKP
jgi:radical SAM superfamily enzyme YgiQ (UPF0313 family)